MWKQAKRRQRRNKRACFEERPRFPAPFGAGNRLAGRCFCGEALPEAEEATRPAAPKGLGINLPRRCKHSWYRSGALPRRSRRWCLQNRDYSLGWKRPAPRPSGMPGALIYHRRSIRTAAPGASPHSTTLSPSLFVKTPGASLLGVDVGGDLLHRLGEGGVFLHPLLHLLQGVEDGGVVSAAKLLADVHQ